MLYTLLYVNYTSLLKVKKSKKELACIKNLLCIIFSIKHLSFPKLYMLSSWCLTENNKIL